MNGLAYQLGLLFWKDLETHHPGIGSLNLAPDVAVAWKQRMQSRTVPTTGPAGERTQARVPRLSVVDHLTIVRSFYLDIAEWAATDPARWAQWAVPCPVRPGDLTHRQALRRRKSRTDQRTRERLPVLSRLIAAAERELAGAASRLAAAAAAAPGQEFTAGSQTLARAILQDPSPRIWAEDRGTGKRRNLTEEEEHAFWAWASIELLRHSGIRIEELAELSHHSLVRYQLPGAELIPLLHITPSKTDIERMLVISPELSEVLAVVIARVRGQGTGAVPLVTAYDPLERVWNPPSPLLLQRRAGAEDRPFSRHYIKRRIEDTARAAGLTASTGGPLTFTPHDMRRIFTTEALQNGLPPHICQLILGHKNLNTTMGYNTVYPEKVITGHRAFLARRRQLRPAEEYRTRPPTPNGRNSSATSNAERSPSATAAAPTGQAASTRWPANDAPCSVSTPPSGPACSSSATAWPHGSPKPRRRAGSASSKASGSPSRRSRTNSSRWTRGSPASPP